jgi:hypothetical protein
VSVQMERAQKNMFDRNSEILLAITGIPERWGPAQPNRLRER